MGVLTFPHPHHLLDSSVLDILVGMEWYFAVDSVCISLMANEISYNPLAFSSLNCLFLPFAIFLLVSCPFLVDLQVNILETNYSSIVSFTNVFSQSVNSGYYVRIKYCPRPREYYTGLSH